MMSSQLKQDIKNISKQQIILKKQQKTVKLRGTRVIHSRDARFKREYNQYKLRHLFIVYDKIRGIEPHSTKKYVNKKYIASLLEKYNKSVII